MHVLVIGSDPQIFDPTSAVRGRLQTYAASVGTLHVLSRAPRQVRAAYQDGLQEGSLVIHAVGGGKLTGLLALLARAKRIIKEKQVVLVSAQDPFEHGLVALRAAQATGIKLHIQVHTDFCSLWFVKGHVLRAAHVRMPLLNTIRRRIADHVLPKADGVRAVSERVRTSLTERYPNVGPRIWVVPIATAVSLPEPVPLPERSFTFSIMTIGRLEPEKRIEDAIDALARIARQYPMVGLIIVGDGRSRRALERRVRRLGLAGRVLFLGWRADVQGLLQSAHVYLHTSAYEGYGLTLIEAALARVPIVTTDVGIVGEVLRGYEDVLVAPVADPAALAVHLAGLVEDVPARKLLAMNAERRAKEHLAGLVNQPAQVAADFARTLSQPS